MEQLSPGNRPPVEYCPRSWFVKGFDKDMEGRGSDEIRHESRFALLRTLAIAEVAGNL